MKEFRNVIDVEHTLSKAEKVIIDFYSPSCVPCKRLDADLKNYEADPRYAGKLNVFRLNVEEYPQVSQRYGVTSLPTVMMFRRGVPDDNVLRGHSKKDLEDFLRAYLAG